MMIHLHINKDQNSQAVWSYKRDKYCEWITWTKTLRLLKWWYVVKYIPKISIPIGLLLNRESISLVFFLIEKGFPNDNQMFSTKKIGGLVLQKEKTKVFQRLPSTYEVQWLSDVKYGKKICQHIGDTKRKRGNTLDLSLHIWGLQ